LLKGIDPLVNADLLYALAAMGHGDELAVVDCNFPATSTARRLIRLDGADLVSACRAIMSLFPLDTYVERPVLRMEVVGAPDEIPAVQADCFRVFEAAEGRRVEVGALPREAFYERSRQAFAVVATSEQRPYGCFLLAKGVINL
jgi:L-fucose mutarotase